MTKILDLQKALELGRVSAGLVYVNSMPQVRQGKRNDFMVGKFVNGSDSVEFKIWEERTFKTVLNHGVGIYEVEVEGSEFNGSYLTVRKINVSSDKTVKSSDFLAALPKELIDNLQARAYKAAQAAGVSDKAIKLLDELLNAPELDGRFFVEGAAVSHHDNQVRGLAHHSFKMLEILATILTQHPNLQAQADLLALGVTLHDVGKVWEYDELSMSEYWYSNHRARGLEYLAMKKDLIMANYDEKFYRQMQAIIIGHHGDYGDRPETVACAIVHFIDTLESQVTGMLEDLNRSVDNRIFIKDWGYLAGF
ncbi:HD domain-containing protein [Amygdalobacter nucleatus]|uniref:HD domain-containing protein n=1 Tax=Amygdalobacter nucleatus TaxID=3029274 RepID=UPI002799143F|nr:HD domain-containing protein [Amygdalobacter nucleatus]WEG36806.1 hypothetical protein PYS63_06640 [Amygdalobacter nucleatus]